MFFYLVRVTDQKKQRKDKPAHKENEAIEFEFNIGVDDCAEIAFNMYKEWVTFGEFAYSTHCKLN
jgi:Oxidative-stress-responsive kinase 1 C-terminal domain